MTVRRFGPALFVALVALVAARAAMLPGVGFWDTAELQVVGPVLGTAHPGGFPTYSLLGWAASVVLQPFGEPAFRMNLFAGLCLAAAAGLTTDLVRALTRSTSIGVLAGIGLAVTPVAWSIGTHAEAHALHLAFVALVLRLLVAWEMRVRADAGHRADRWLVAAAVAFGLSVGNHGLTLLLAPGIAAFVWAVDRQAWRRPRLVLTCGLALATTVALVYLELPLRAGPFRAPLVYGRPETWDGFWYVVLGEQFRGSLSNPLADPGGLFADLVERTVGQFGPLAILVPIAFLATAARARPYALLTGVTALITCLFAGSYVNAEIGRYYLGPLLMAWTWLAILAVEAGRGLVALAARAAARRPIRDDPVAARGRAVQRARTVGAALLLVALVPTAVDLPGRYDAVDEIQYLDARPWLDNALSLLEPDAVVVSWWSYSTPLWYAQRVEGQRPDIRIIDDRTRLDENLGDVADVIDANLGRAPVYVIRDDQAEVDLLAERYFLGYLDGPDAHSLTRVLGRKDASS